MTVNLISLYITADVKDHINIITKTFIS